MVKQLIDLTWESRFTQKLAADPNVANFSRYVLQGYYSWVQPRKPSAPQLIAYSPEVLQLLDCDEEIVKSPTFTEVFSGYQLLSTMKPYAQVYGGHQFGVWAGQLGDGRVIHLGEIRNQAGEYWTLQLKGAGHTPYSRHADGLAVLRSSIREFLASEAMFHLGIPTTRALSLILTGDTVIRDRFYDGHPQAEWGAVVCRVAPSFLRFGHFELFSARKDISALRQLVDFTIRHDFPHLGEPSNSTYREWFYQICRTTAELIVQWQRVGFVHGVMNTDNLSILGLSLDYGPFGWLEDYQPLWTPNTTDAGQKRYAFARQPQIGLWNLQQLAQALYPLIQEVSVLEQGLILYLQTFQSGYQQMLTAKLGLQHYQAEDEYLHRELEQILAAVETDMTVFFRLLATLNSETLINATDEQLIAPLLEAYYSPQQLQLGYQQRIANWLRNYLQRLQQQAIHDDLRRLQMNATNPKYILRNYLAQQVIEQAEKGDFSGIQQLYSVLQHPYDEQLAHHHFAQKRPEWAKYRADCSMLSCSS